MLCHFGYKKNLTQKVLILRKKLLILVLQLAPKKCSIYLKIYCLYDTH
jgi:hypothetical protein